MGNNSYFWGEGHSHSLYTYPTRKENNPNIPYPLTRSPVGTNWAHHLLSTMSTLNTGPHENRKEKGRRKKEKTAQRNKAVEGSRGEA